MNATAFDNFRTNKMYSKSMKFGKSLSILTFANKVYDLEF